MENKAYKIMQVSNILISKYGYNLIVLKEYQNLIDKEAILFNKDNLNYQIIRINLKEDNDFNDDKRFNDYLKYFNKIADKDLKKLDIHICKTENIDSEELYLEDGFYGGLDIEPIYPELINAVHNVNDPQKEMKRINLSLKQFFTTKLKNQPFLIRYPYLFTYITIILCIGNFLLKYYFYTRYGENNSLLIMGADYKTLTYGCKQYWRLITYAFVHGSLLHLFCNMSSLSTIGKYVEYKFGHFNYLLILFVSILTGSLTQGILTDNSLCVGMSAGIYGLFVVFIIDGLNSGIFDLSRMAPVIFLNICLNFLSNISWTAHLGGAIGGLAIYYLLKNESKLTYLPLVILLVGGLLAKYLMFNNISTLYGATDLEYLEMLQKLGLNTEHLFEKLIEVYNKFGG